MKNGLKPLCDLHIHTIASGHAFSTADEIAAAAEQKGLELIALTDHGPEMPGGAHMYYFWNLKALPEKLHNVRVLKGAEVNILDHEGSLDLPDDILETLDVVIAALHPFMSYDGTSKEINTQTLLKVLDNPRINILAHLGNPLFPVDFEAIIDKAIDKKVLIEINSSSKKTRAGSYENCVEIAGILKRKNAYTILSSDAHYKDDVARFDDAIAITEEAGLPTEKILNYDPEQLLHFLTKRP